MARERTKYTIRKLVRAYLVFHRGKEVTAREMAEWINNPENNFGLNTAVKPKEISKMLYVDMTGNRNTILSDVERNADVHPMTYKLH